MSGGGAETEGERERERISSRLCVASSEPDAGLSSKISRYLSGKL